MTATVSIVGLGRVGAQQPAVGGVPRTHLDAVLATPGLELSSLVDPDPQAIAWIRSRPDLRDVELLNDLTELPAGVVEVIVLATPTTRRLHDARSALRSRPRVLIIEKPLAPNSHEAELIAREAAALGIAVRVNFHRRFDPTFVALRRELPDSPRLISGYYSKGLLNYGSHVIDLLLDWFGPIVEVQAIGRALGPPGDPTIGFRCRLAEGFEAIISGVDQVSYDLFELQLLFPHCRLTLGAGGVERVSERAQPGRYYPGYTHLGPGRPMGPATPVGGFAELYQGIVAHLDRGAPLEGCSPEEATLGLQAIDGIRQSARTGVSVAIEGAFDGR